MVIDGRFGRGGGRAGKAAAAAGGVAACIYLSVALLGMGPPALTQALSTWIPAGAAFVAAAASGVMWTRDPARTNGSYGWLLAAAGFFMASMSLAALGLSGAGGALAEYAHAFALSLAPWLFFGAGVDFFHRLRLGDRARVIADSVVAASGLALPGYYFVIVKVWSRPGDWNIIRALISIHPMALACVMFAGVAVFQAVYLRGRLRKGPAWLAGSLVLFAVPGCLQSFSHSTFGAASPVIGQRLDWIQFGILASACAAIFAVVHSWRDAGGEWEGLSSDDESQEPAKFGIVRVAVPHITASLAFIVTSLYEITTAGHVSPGVVIFGFLLMSLALSRQVVTLLRSQAMLHDNALLTDKLRAVSESLEETVAQRTRQLGSMHQLAKAINNTKDPGEVLSMAAMHTKTAIHADAVVIWLAEKDGSGRQVMKGALQTGLHQHAYLLPLLQGMPPTTTVESYPLPAAPADPNGAIGALLRSPILHQGRLVGMIGAIKMGSAFPRFDWDMLESIGHEVGTALVHARQFKQAKDAADLDPVTGLFNHRAIHQALDLALERAGAERSLVSVMMMDMNNFKMFNDTYGHPAGDEALRRVARALAEGCQNLGWVGRYGGDEFLAILPNTTDQSAAELADAVQQRLLKQGFIPNPLDGRVIPITLSFGIASFPRDSASRHELIAMADANLYAAKRSEQGIKMTSEFQRENRTLKSEHSFAVLDGMVTAVDNKDSYTRRHSEDVAEYSLWIAEELGLSPDTLKTIRIGALLHDVGKIAVPDEILRKPGRLTPEEFEILKRHPRLGALIVGGVPGMEHILDIVQHHHERWDGKGYPDELRADEIPLLGRLVAVADTFSAMTTDRPYRRGMALDKAISEIMVNAGSQFDPVMAQAFINAINARIAKGSLPEALKRLAVDANQAPQPAQAPHGHPRIAA